MRYLCVAVLLAAGLMACSESPVDAELDAPSTPVAEPIYGSTSAALFKTDDDQPLAELFSGFGKTQAFQSQGAMTVSADYVISPSGLLTGTNVDMRIDGNQLPEVQHFTHTGSTISYGPSANSTVTVPLPPAFEAAVRHLQPALQQVTQRSGCAVATAHSRKPLHSGTGLHAAKRPSRSARGKKKRDRRRRHRDVRFAAGSALHVPAQRLPGRRSFERTGCSPFGADASRWGSTKNRIHSSKSR